ncbi:hypothetical protein NWF32_31315 [Pseudomonas qingdaonensis]|nr:hypothetical protein [Pseudomonas qingdaonensis]
MTFADDQIHTCTDLGPGHLSKLFYPIAVSDEGVLDSAPVGAAALGGMSFFEFCIGIGDHGQVAFSQPCTQKVGGQALGRNIAQGEQLATVDFDGRQPKKERWGAALRGDQITGNGDTQSETLVPRAGENTPICSSPLMVSPSHCLLTCSVIALLLVIVEGGDSQIASGLTIELVLAAHFQQRTTDQVCRLLPLSCG